jgi:hypothetical protein
MWETHPPVGLTTKQVRDPQLPTSNVFVTGKSDQRALDVDEPRQIARCASGEYLDVALTRQPNAPAPRALKFSQRRPPNATRPPNGPKMVPSSGSRSPDHHR